MLATLRGRVRRLGFPPGATAANVENIHSSHVPAPAELLAVQNFSMKLFRISQRGVKLVLSDTVSSASEHGKHMYVCILGSLESPVHLHREEFDHVAPGLATATVRPRCATRRLAFSSMKTEHRLPLMVPLS